MVTARSHRTDTRRSAARWGGCSIAGTRRTASGRSRPRSSSKRGPAPSPGRGSSYFTTGVFINGWTRPLREVIPLLRRAFEAARACGDINVASFSSLVIVEFCFSAGETLAEVAAEAERQLEYTRHVRQYIQDYVESHAPARAALARASAPGARRRRPGRCRDEAAASLAALSAPDFLAIEYLVFGDYRSAAAVAESYRTLAHMGSAADVALAWYVAALAYACHFDDAPPAERAQLRQRLAELEQHHRAWERRCAATFRNRRALISAEAARIDGRDADAIRLYEEAITAARQDGFVQNEGLAAELAARFCRMRGLPTIADAYLKRARACYQRWGAEGKLDQLDRLHASLRPPPEASGPTATLAVRRGPSRLALGAQGITDHLQRNRTRQAGAHAARDGSGAKRGATGRAGLQPRRQAVRGGSGGARVERTCDERTCDDTPRRGAPRRLVAGPPVTAPLRGADPKARHHRQRGGQEPGRGRVPGPHRALLGAVPAHPQAVQGAGFPLPGKSPPRRDIHTWAVGGGRGAGRPGGDLGRERAVARGERTARAAAEAAEHRAALLSEASARLSESLDYSAQLTWLSRFCVRSLADWCVIDILEGPHIIPAAGAHREATKESTLQALQQAFPPHSGSPHPAATVLGTGRPVLLRTSPTGSCAACAWTTNTRA